VYILKYAGKPEVASQSYEELAQRIIPFINETWPFQSMVTKLMNKLIGERNYSAQEVCRMPLSLPLKQASRALVHVDIRLLEAQSRLVRIEDGEARRGLSVLEHYMQRPEDLENISYHQFLLCHNHKPPYSRRPKANGRVINYFPRYPLDQVEDHGRAKLVLHHPFRRVEDLLYIEAIHDEPCVNYFEAYTYCQDHCYQGHDGYDNPLPESEESVYKPTPDNPDEEAQINMDAEWIELARQLPDQDGNNADAWNLLGRRPEDRVDWSDRVGKDPGLQSDWWKIQKADHPAPP
jgi:hypothetical protein